MILKVLFICYISVSHTILSFFYNQKIFPDFCMTFRFFRWLHIIRYLKIISFQKKMKKKRKEKHNYKHLGMQFTCCWNSCSTKIFFSLDCSFTINTFVSIHYILRKAKLITLLIFQDKNLHYQWNQEMKIRKSLTEQQKYVRISFIKVLTICYPHCNRIKLSTK